MGTYPNVLHDEDRKRVFRKTRQMVRTTSLEWLVQQMFKRPIKRAKTYACIYGIVDMRIKQIRYVGRTTSPLPVRLAQHIRDSKVGHSFKDRWLQQLLEDEGELLAISICSVPATEAARVESLIMWRFHHEVGPLVNTETMSSHLADVEFSLRQKYPPRVSKHGYDWTLRKIRSEVEKYLKALLLGQIAPRKVMYTGRTCRIGRGRRIKMHLMQR